MTLDEQIDKILQALVDFATQRFDDELGIAYSAPVAKLAIKALIADEVKKAMWQFGLEKDVKYDVKKSDKVIVITPTQPSNKSKE